MDKPLLLIDVDGVLNPFPLRGNTPAGFRAYDGLAAFPVLLSRRHGDMLRALMDRYELVWATGWEHDANSVIAPRIGLPGDLPVITFDHAVSGGTWKLPDVAAFVGDRSCAWLDDELESDAYEWARNRFERGILSLPIDVDPRVGLTSEHVARLERFALRFR